LTSKFKKFKNYLNELREFPIREFLIFCGRWAPLPLCQNLLTFNLFSMF